MGSLSNFLITILQTIIFLWIFTIIPGIPPHLNFSYDYCEPPLTFTGPLKINGKLNNAKRLVEGELKGPECLQVFNNELYMSVHGGKILKLSKGKLQPVLKIGESCKGLWEERICGRPLGFVFDQVGNLYCADAYNGILKANISTGEITTLVSMSDPIDGHLPMLPNAVDISKDGTIYWTDSSTTHHLDDGLFIFLGSGTGRLLKYDPKLRRNEVLIDNLHFANGLALSSDETFIVVAETAKARIWKYYIKGEKAGKKEIFIDRLPGLPDNLKRDGRGFIIALLDTVDDSPFSILKLHKFPYVRKFISRIMALCELLFVQINIIHPNDYFSKIIHWIGHFESLHVLYKDHVVIVLLDQNGNITGSLHATDGNVKSISDIISHQGNYYLGSPFNSYLGAVKIS